MEEDYCLLGIVSDEPDYKLCWLLNSELNASFTREEDIHLFSKKMGEEQQIRLFLHEDEKQMITYRVIANRANTGYYLPDLKQIDYLLHIQGELDHAHINQILRTIAGIKSVRMCVPVDLAKIRDRERLQLW